MQLTGSPGSLLSLSFSKPTDHQGCGTLFLLGWRDVIKVWSKSSGQSLWQSSRVVIVDNLFPGCRIVSALSTFVRKRVGKHQLHILRNKRHRKIHPKDLGTQGDHSLVWHNLINWLWRPDLEPTKQGGRLTTYENCPCWLCDLFENDQSHPCSWGRPF